MWSRPVWKIQIFIHIGRELPLILSSDIKGGCCCCSNTRSCEKVLFEVQVRLYEYVSLCRSYISRRPKLFISFPFLGLAPSNVGFHDSYRQFTTRGQYCHKCHNTQNKFVGKINLKTFAFVLASNGVFLFTRSIICSSG